MEVFIGDIDDYYRDIVEGEHRRWAVWSKKELLGRFDTKEEAERFIENKLYLVGENNGVD